uniref:Uncharacterized protein n=1 Tax=Phaeomonas parva TaxID=124430 RepID=A0A7S1UH17_9STRA|mmetsp:Transcript_5562/g.15553  ORF Transcript_5562/g.15553 Transcript_5562/m.15553 type:complete len:877 (+) Transcript_5562:20-2650(+)
MSTLEGAEGEKAAKPYRKSSLLSLRMSFTGVVVRKLDRTGAFDAGVSPYRALHEEAPDRATGLFVLVFVMLGLVSFGFNTCFSGMGYGEEVFDQTRGHAVKGDYDAMSGGMIETLGGMLSVIAFFLLWLLYTIDAEYWTAPVATSVRAFAISASLIMIVIAMVLSSPWHPYYPVCLLMAAMTIASYVTYLVSKHIFTTWDPYPSFPVFFQFVGLPATMVAACIFVAWMAWVFIMGRQWGPDLQQKYAKNIGCLDEEGEASTDDDGADDEDCLGAFILWVHPLFNVLVLLYLAGLSHAMRNLVQERGDAAKNEVKFMGGFIVAIFFVFWVGASLAGVIEGLTVAIFAFGMAAIATFAIIVIFIMGLDSIKEIAEIKSHQAVEEHPGTMDWVRAMFLCVCAPLVIVFIPISALNQFVRRLACVPCTKRLAPGEERFTITSEFYNRLKTCDSWNWTSILRKTILWGLLYQSLAVIASKFTILLLGWINEQIADSNVFLVSAIVFVVGITLFLLPPVPGAPIYYLIGLLMPGVAGDEFGDVGAIIYGMILSLIIKLCACFMQQVVIGGNMSSFVQVRQICMVNTGMMKCFKMILMEPSLTLSKVGILVGGPDWPTSVVCGILKIPVFQTMVGTTPAIFLIAPCVMAGAFYFYSVEKGGMYGTFAVIMMMVSFCVQSGSLLIAAYYVEKMLRENREVIDAQPDDQEVVEADERDLRASVQLEEATKWKRLFARGQHMKAYLLIIFAALMVLSCWLTTFFSKRCFRTFALTDTIDDKLNGKALTMDGSAGLTKPLGVVALYLIFIALFGYLWFYFWARKWSENEPDLTAESLERKRALMQAGVEKQRENSARTRSGSGQRGGGSGWRKSPAKVAPATTDEKR